MANTGISSIYKIYPFSQLTDNARSQLEQGVRVRNLASGQTLFRIGETLSNAHYLLSGEISFLDGQGKVFERIQRSGQDEPMPLPDSSPSPHLARTETKVDILSINLELFNRVISEHIPRSPPSRQAGTGRQEAGADTTQPQANWQEAFLRAAGYQGIARHNLEAVFNRVHPVPVKRGEIFIRQWARPDYFYIIGAGRCVVTRESEMLGYSVRLAEYGVGASVGEDALITDRPRSSTVTMLTDGCLMRLDGEDFRVLLQPSLTRAVGYAEARAMVADGATWLDVRMPDEVRGRERLANSICIPFPIIRARLFAAEPERRYVVVCSEGMNSAIMAFVMCKYGYDAYYLSDGIATIPAAELN